MKKIIIKIVTLFCLLITSQSHALDFAEAVTLAHDNDATFQIAHANYIAALEKQPQSQSALLPYIGLNLYASHTNSKISHATGSFTAGSSNFNTTGSNYHCPKHCITRNCLMPSIKAKPKSRRLLPVFKPRNMRWWYE